MDVDPTTSANGAFNGDVAAALGAITAPTLLMPCVSWRERPPIVVRDELASDVVVEHFSFRM